MSENVFSPSLRIMVASTVYGFQDQIEQICSVLQVYGYEVWNSTSENHTCASWSFTYRELPKGR